MYEQIKNIGDYKIYTKYQVGQGQFGKVYEGENIITNEKVAVKQINLSNIQTNDVFNKQLEMEINVLKKIRHPNVVELKGVCRADNQVFIFQEFCNNGDVLDYMKSLKNISSEERESICIDIAKQIAAGMMYIHSNSIIHRDLKPQNILMNGNQVKIIDFGLAKNLAEQDIMTKSNVGTPFYMSPQVLQKGSYTSKTDIWSFGMLFYELLFQNLPYVAKIEQELLDQIINNPIKFAELRCNDISREILSKTLVLDEQSRSDFSQILNMINQRLLSKNYSGQVFSIEQNAAFSATSHHPRKSIGKKNALNQMNEYCSQDDAGIQYKLNTHHEGLSYLFFIGQTMMEAESFLSEIVGPEVYLKCLISIMQYMIELRKIVTDLIEIVNTQNSKNEGLLWTVQYIQESLEVYSDFFQDVTLECSKYKINSTNTNIFNSLSNIILLIQANLRPELLQKHSPYLQRQILAFIDYTANYLKFRHMAFKDIITNICPKQCQLSTDKYFDYIKDLISQFRL